MMELMVKFAVSPVASHSGCSSGVTMVLMGLQVMLESGPVGGLLGEKAADRREPPSVDRLFLNLMMSFLINSNRFMEIFSLQYQRKEGMTLCFFPVCIDPVKQHCTLY